jgi:hypothetical protein
MYLTERIPAGGVRSRTHLRSTTPPRVFTLILAQKQPDYRDKAKLTLIDDLGECAKCWLQIYCTPHGHDFRLSSLVIDFQFNDNFFRT